MRPARLVVHRVAHAALRSSTLPTFLFKTEPGEYSYADLQRDKRTTWSGVKNAAALGHLRACTAGDEVLIYHTGDERAIVGLAKVVCGAYEDPSRIDELKSLEPKPGKAKPKPTTSGPKWAVVDLAPIRAAKAPVPLARIKADGRFKDLGLVRQSRLSVMPVPPALYRILREWAGL